MAPILDAGKLQDLAVVDFCYPPAKRKPRPTRWSRRSRLRASRRPTQTLGTDAFPSTLGRLSSVSFGRERLGASTVEAADGMPLAASISHGHETPDVFAFALIPKRPAHSLIGHETPGLSAFASTYGRPAYIVFLVISYLKQLRMSLTLMTFHLSPFSQTPALSDSFPISSAGAGLKFSPPRIVALVFRAPMDSHQPTGIRTTSPVLCTFLTKRKESLFLVPSNCWNTFPLQV